MPKVNANGLELEYETHGQGEPLVMIMGIGAQLVHWPPGFVEALVDRGFRVILFDNRDVGLSEKLKDAAIPDLVREVTRWSLGLSIDSPYDLSDMAADVTGLMDSLGLDDAHILGASLGGMVAQTLAIEHPARVRTLTSIMSHTGARQHVVIYPWTLRALIAPTPKTAEQAGDNTVRFLRACGSRGFALEESAVRERAALAFERCVYPAGFRRQFAAVLRSGSRARKLRQLDVATLVVHGTDDRLLRPAGGRATARAISGAKLMMVDGMGHDFPREVWPSLSEAIARHAGVLEGALPRA